ncbi:hypothetical protein Hte_008369 [Hypoxylon texense]
MTQSGPFQFFYVDTLNLATAKTSLTLHEGLTEGGLDVAAALKPTQAGVVDNWKFIVTSATKRGTRGRDVRGAPEPGQRDPPERARGQTGAPSSATAGPAATARRGRAARPATARKSWPSEPFTFQLCGSGQTRELGEEFRLVALMTALKMYTIEEQKMVPSS